MSTIDWEASITHHYHQRTKYDPETIAAKGKSLDWNQQPIPFKDYKLGKTFDLKPYLSQKFSSETDLTTQNWQRLSRLLQGSYGLTARLETLGSSPFYLRSAPSAGGLYPAEVYVISKGTSLLPPGLYNYQPRTHSLLQYWESEVWSDLQAACWNHPVLTKVNMAIATTAVFYRSSWRYEDRAYRRICLDTGHLLGNIELTCAINQYRPHLIGGFQDEAMNRLLYLDSDQEGTISIIPLEDLTPEDSSLPSGTTALPSPVTTDYPVLKDGELLSAFHRATQIAQTPRSSSSLQSSLEDKYNFPFCVKISTQTSPIDWKPELSGLEETLWRRRSTREYTGADLTLEELKELLHFTYQPQDYLDQGLDPSPDYFDLGLVETFVAVSGVEGLEEGCYYYAPQAQELRQIRFKNFRRELHYLCLGQPLGRDASAIVFHTADLKQAISQYGDRVYRYLHLDAGHLGQRLNLAAIYLNLGVSGIGGFFDDQVNEVLGIPEKEAVLYITTLGRPR